jgi:hypothetical protein
MQIYSSFFFNLLFHSHQSALDAVPDAPITNSGTHPAKPSAAKSDRSWAAAT